MARQKVVASFFRVRGELPTMPSRFRVLWSMVSGFGARVGLAYRA